MMKTNNNAIVESDYQVISIQGTNSIFELLMEFKDSFTNLDCKTGEYMWEIANKLSLYAHVLIYKIKDKNAAFATIYANDHKTLTSYISFIAVAEEYRNMHLGTMLMEKLFLLARESGMKYIKLEVLDSNINAKCFYEKCGFKKICKASDETIYMIKEL